jgi:hypothetical protein
MKHTKGPWLVHYDEPMAVIADEEGDDIAEVYNTDDAQLMAAAPELLEALERLIDLVLIGRWDKLEDATEHARVAIAKTKGE